MTAVPAWNQVQHPKIWDWFHHEVLRGRIVDSALRSLLLLLGLLVTALGTIAVFRAPLAPLSWLTAPMSALLTPSSWFYDALLTAAYLATTVMFAKNFSLVPVRGWFKTLTSGPVLASLAGNAVAAGVITRCYLGMVGGEYSALTAKCSTGGTRKCLIEPHVFLVMSGFYFGLSHWFRLHFCNESLVAFPPVNLHGTTQLKLKFWHIVVRSFKTCARDLRWFYIFYFAYGHRFAYFLSSTFRLELPPTSEMFWMSRLSGHATMLALCLALNSFLAVCIRLTWEVNRIGLRAPLPMTLEEMTAAMRQEKGKGKGSELLKHLAFQDFVDMCMSSRARRSEIFTLSQPGGHPHNWNNLSGVVLKAINDFITGLNEATSSNNNNLISAATASNTNETAKDPKAASKQESALKKLWAKIKKNPLFSSQPEELARAKFAEAQIAIWASEGLSYLVSASAFEDQYGVVQKSLAELLSVMLNLQKTVERHKGLTTNARKGRYSDPTSEEESRDHQLKQELRVSVRTSLYRICTTFGDHILAVPLSAEHRQKLESYKNFTEGRA